MRETTLTLPYLQVANGVRIEDTCSDAQRLADALQVHVPFMFNGVHCDANPGGSADALVANFHLALPKSGYASSL